MTTTDRDTVRIVATTPYGQVAANGYMCWLLTPCCQASGKGWMDEGDEGLVLCRGCYHAVDWRYGDADDATPEGIERFVQRNGGAL